MTNGGTIIHISGYYSVHVSVLSERCLVITCNRSGQLLSAQSFEPMGRLCWQKGQELASLTSWLLSANCRIAVRPQFMYRRESQVLYELIFVAFDWFRILLYDYLLILTPILTLHYITRQHSVYSFIGAVDTKTNSSVKDAG